MRCVRDGSENPLCFFFKKHKDCSEQPDPKLRGGTTKQFAGSRPYFGYAQHKERILKNKSASRGADLSN
jgi:hypothetical protein